MLLILKLVTIHIFETIIIDTMIECQYMDQS